MNEYEYEIIPIDGPTVKIQADKIRETEDVILFFRDTEVIGIVPLLNIIAVKRVKELIKQG